MSIRVLHVVHNLEWGGLQRHIHLLAKHQLRMGFVHKVIALSEPLFLAPFEQDGISTACAARPAFDTAPSPQTVAALKKHIEEFGADVVHSHIVFADHHARVAAFGTGRPLVRTLHSFGPGWTVREQQEESASEHMVAATICVSDWGRKTAIEYGLNASKMHVILNGVEVDHFRPMTLVEKRRHRAQMGFPEHERLIVCVSRLERSKNPMLLLRAASLLDCERTQVLLVGDGGLRRELESTAAQLGLTSTFTGTTMDPWPFIASSDVSVLCSRFEGGRPYSLLESMSSGVPVVATAVGGSAELLRTSGGGVPTKPDDPQSMAHALSSILGDVKLSRKLSEAGRAFILQRHRVERTAEETSLVYRRVLK